jgi:hypothetical protein
MTMIKWKQNAKQGKTNGFGNAKVHMSEFRHRIIGMDKYRRLNDFRMESMELLRGELLRVQSEQNQVLNRTRKVLMEQELQDSKQTASLFIVIAD